MVEGGAESRAEVTTSLEGGAKLFAQLFPGDELFLINSIGAVGEPGVDVESNGGAFELANDIGFEWYDGLLGEVEEGVAEGDLDAVGGMEPLVCEEERVVFFIFTFLTEVRREGG